MRKVLFTVLLGVIAIAGIAQTAPNFTCNDCKGDPHDLYTELDAGKVIVLCWVMPCGACVGPTLTTYNVVESYQANYPNTVFMYLADDFANTNCVSLNSWAAGIGIVNATLFSNSAIDMNDYGGPGMPKIVVVAGADHQVLYNTNNTVNATLLQNAIDSALNSTAIVEPGKENVSFSVNPNPVTGISTLAFNLQEDAIVECDLMDITGKQVRNIYKGNLQAGYNQLICDARSDGPGVYFIKLSVNGESRLVKIAVLH
jgi:hypothetical protein